MDGRPAQDGHLRLRQLFSRLTALPSARQRIGQTNPASPANTTTTSRRPPMAQTRPTTRPATPASARAHAYPIATVAYCAAHGITPKALLASAEFNERMSSRRGYEHSAALARRLRGLAREV